MGCAEAAVGIAAGAVLPPCLETDDHEQRYAPDQNQPAKCGGFLADQFGGADRRYQQHIESLPRTVKRKRACALHCQQQHGNGPDQEQHGGKGLGLMPVLPIGHHHPYDEKRRHHDCGEDAKQVQRLAQCAAGHFPPCDRLIVRQRGSVAHEHDPPDIRCLIEPVQGAEHRQHRVARDEKGTPQEKQPRQQQKRQRAYGNGYAPQRSLDEI